MILLIGRICPGGSLRRRGWVCCCWHWGRSCRGACRRGARARWRTCERNKITYTLITMLKNYLLLALRVIRRNKLYSLINVGCLAIGIAVAMTVMVYVLHEHSDDSWHANAGRIFAVSTSVKYGSVIWQDYQL